MAILDQVINDRYAIYNGDCLEVMPTFPDGSIHFSIYSPPFAGLYHYSSSTRDLSNCRDYEEFMAHYEFVVPEIHRLTMPGRLTAVHCMDVPSGNTGCDHYIDFPGDIIRLHERLGFRLASPRIHIAGEEHVIHPRVAIWKEPLAVRNRTLTKALAHKTIVEDSASCTVAGADYLLIFRKGGKNPEPITHKHGLTHYAGEREVPRELHRYKGWTGKQTENRYSHWIWRQYASCIWDDIRGNTGKRNQSGVLPYREARDAEDEKHLHPLQLDVIERAVELWSNPGDKVLTPFLGVGSEAAGAIENGRRAIGIELKPSYFRQATKNLAIVAERGLGDKELQSGLFDDQIQDDVEIEDEPAEATA